MLCLDITGSRHLNITMRSLDFDHFKRPISQVKKNAIFYLVCKNGLFQNMKQYKYPVLCVCVYFYLFILFFFYFFFGGGGVTNEVHSAIKQIYILSSTYM